MKTYLISILACILHESEHLSTEKSISDTEQIMSKKDILILGNKEESEVTNWNSYKHYGHVHTRHQPAEFADEGHFWDGTEVVLSHPEDDMLTDIFDKKPEYQEITVDDTKLSWTKNLLKILFYVKLAKLVIVALVVGASWLLALSSGFAGFIAVIIAVGVYCLGLSPV